MYMLAFFMVVLLLEEVQHQRQPVQVTKVQHQRQPVQVTKHLCDKAVPFNGSIGNWFQTTVGVWQGCLLSPVFFSIFLERIMTAALQDHEGAVSIGGRTITNLRFADDIDGLAGEEEKLTK